LAKEDGKGGKPQRDRDLSRVGRGEKDWWGLGFVILPLGEGERKRDARPNQRCRRRKGVAKKKGGNFFGTPGPHL